MGKSIVEKLGIKPLEAYSIPYGEHAIYIEEVRELEQQRNDMLEALIDIAAVTWDYCMNDTFYHDDDITLNDRKVSLNNSDFPKLKSIIEKADPKHRSWEQIEELYNA